MAMMVGQDEEPGMGEDDAADRVGGGEHEDMFPLQPPDQELGRQGTFSCLTEEHCSSTRLFLRRHGHQWMDASRVVKRLARVTESK